MTRPQHFFCDNSVGFYLNSNDIALCVRYDTLQRTLQRNPERAPAWEILLNSGGIFKRKKADFRCQDAEWQDSSLVVKEEYQSGVREYCLPFSQYIPSSHRMSLPNDRPHRKVDHKGKIAPTASILYDAHYIRFVLTRSLFACYRVYRLFCYGFRRILIGRSILYDQNQLGMSWLTTVHAPQKHDTCCLFSYSRLRMTFHVTLQLPHYPRLPCVIFYWHSLKYFSLICVDAAPSAAPRRDFVVAMSHFLIQHPDI